MPLFPRPYTAAQAHDEGRHKLPGEFASICPDCAAIVAGEAPTGDPMLRILSLGAGVQSTCVALMSAYGELPKFDACIFSDTGWEPAAVYAHLKKLTAELKKHGIPVYVVSAGNIREDHINPQGDHLFIQNPVKYPEYKGKQRTFIPVFLLTDIVRKIVGKKADVAGLKNVRRAKKGDSEVAVQVAGRYVGEIVETRKGLTRRTCTKTYKIEPVEKKISELIGRKPRAQWPKTLRVIQSFGISWDESQRMSTSARAAIVHDYPLIDRRMTRDDCHAWMAEHGWTAPRSACIGCPFHSNEEWRRLRDESPAEWDEAVEFDHAFRARQQAGLLPMEGTPFLHRDRVPLELADIDSDAPNEAEECEGFCGT